MGGKRGAVLQMMQAQFCVITVIWWLEVSFLWSAFLQTSPGGVSARWSQSEINPVLPLEKGQVIRHNLLISNSRYMRCYQRVGDSEQPTLPTVRTQASHNPPVWRDSCKEICFRGADKSVKSRPTLSAYLDSRERGRKFTLLISSATVHIYGESNWIFGKYKYQKMTSKERKLIFHFMRLKGPLFCKMHFTDDNNNNLCL